MCSMYTTYVHKVRTTYVCSPFIISLAFTSIDGFLIQRHTNVGYNNITSEFDVQGLGLKVKVTVAIFRKKKLCHRSSAYINQWILI